MFFSKIRKIMYNPVNTQFYYIKVGFKGGRSGGPNYIGVVWLWGLFSNAALFVVLVLCVFRSCLKLWPCLWEKREPVTLVFGMCIVDQWLFSLPLGVIDRLCSVIVDSWKFSILILTFRWISCIQNHFWRLPISYVLLLFAGFVCCHCNSYF